jgi:hypothetical protein
MQTRQVAGSQAHQQAFSNASGDSLPIFQERPPSRPHLQAKQPQDDPEQLVQDSHSQELPPPQ